MNPTCCWMSFAARWRSAARGLAVAPGSAAPAPSATDMGAVAGRAVVTVEGLGTPDAPHPLQSAFLALQAGQCGYCLSGILIGAAALLAHNPDPTRAEIARALDGHLCRCGVHNRVLDAVALAAKHIRDGAPA